MKSDRVMSVLMVLLEGKRLIDEMRRLEDIFLGDSIPKNKRKKK